MLSHALPLRRLVRQSCALPSLCGASWRLAMPLLCFALLFIASPLPCVALLCSVVPLRCSSWHRGALPLQCFAPRCFSVLFLCAAVPSDAQRYKAIPLLRISMQCHCSAFRNHSFPLRRSAQQCPAERCLCIEVRGLTALFLCIAAPFPSSRRASFAAALLNSAVQRHCEAKHHGSQRLAAHLCRCLLFKNLVAEAPFAAVAPLTDSTQNAVIEPFTDGSLVLV